MSDDWKERFRKKFVKYDPSPIANEILISGIYLTDIEEFIQLEIKKAKKEERRRIKREVKRIETHSPKTINFLCGMDTDPTGVWIRNYQVLNILKPVNDSLK